MYVQELIDKLGDQRAPRCQMYVEKYWMLYGKDPNLLAKDMMENMYLELVALPDCCSNAVRESFEMFLNLSDNQRKEMISPAIIFARVDISLIKL